MMVMKKLRRVKQGTQPLTFQAWVLSPTPVLALGLRSKIPGPGPLGSRRLAGNSESPLSPLSSPQRGGRWVGRRQGPGRPGSPATGRKGETEAERKHLLVPLPLCTKDHAGDGAQEVAWGFCQGDATLLGTRDVSSLSQASPRLWAENVLVLKVPGIVREHHRQSQETQTPVSHSRRGQSPPPPPPSLSFLFCLRPGWTRQGRTAVVFHGSEVKHISTVTGA